MTFSMVLNAAKVLLGIQARFILAVLGIMSALAANSHQFEHRPADAWVGGIYLVASLIVGAWLCAAGLRAWYHGTVALWRWFDDRAKAKRVELSLSKGASV